MTECCDSLGRSVAAEHQTGGIAREMQHEKHAGREQKERQTRPSQNSKNECSHLRSLLHTYARPLCLVGLASNRR